jgi:hypothetical protein
VPNSLQLINPHCWGTGLPYGLHIRRTGHNPPHGPHAGWVLTTANAAGTNGLTCLPKHEGVRDNKFLVTHPLLNFRDRTPKRTDRGAIEPSNYDIYDIMCRIMTDKFSERIKTQHYNITYAYKNCVTHFVNFLRAVSNCKIPIEEVYRYL